jgi:hypothetical protein
VLASCSASPRASLSCLCLSCFSLSHRLPHCLVVVPHPTSTPASGPPQRGHSGNALSTRSLARHSLPIYIHGLSLFARRRSLEPAFPTIAHTSRPFPTMSSRLSAMLPRADSIEDKFKVLLNDNPLGATARTRFRTTSRAQQLTAAGPTRVGPLRGRHGHWHHARHLHRLPPAAALQHHRICAPSPPRR